RRIDYRSSPQTERFVYDGEDILRIYDQDNNPIARMTFGLGIDNPISLDLDSGSYFYVTDALGSVVGLTDINTTLVQAYRYDSFGRIIQQTPDPPAIIQPFTYTGREWDAVTGIYYYRARQYDPSFGRFLSEDPLGLEEGEVFGGTTNFYPYVENNP